VRRFRGGKEKCTGGGEEDCTGGGEEVRRPGGLEEVRRQGGGEEELRKQRQFHILLLIPLPVSLRASNTV